jgi:prepilin-type N-terminal cleavage/methylation domain-containing protein
MIGIADRSARIDEQFRRGFTVVELLVVIAIIGILLAITIPAVQQSRASARRVQCLSNLRQLGVAINNFESSHKRYPESYIWRVELLPYVDQRSLYEEFSVRILQPMRTPGGPYENWQLTTTIPSFVCPAEPLAGQLACVSYYANIGSGLQAFGFNGFFAPAPNPMFRHGAWRVPHDSGPTSSTDITDGLSNTAAICEARACGFVPSQALTSNKASRAQLLEYFWQTESGLVRIEDFPEKCRLCQDTALRLSRVASGGRGMQSWPWTETNGVHYGAIIHSWAIDHALPPNSPSCGNSYYGIYSATSHHNAGVNCLLGDGSAKLWDESTTVSVWRAIGTRGGGD